jgi:hypothetical protein
VKGTLVLRLAFLLAILAISVPRGFAQGGTPVFMRRYIPPPSETPVRGYIPESEPIPQGWIYAGDAVAITIGVVLLIAAAKAWRASNLFGRQYRFPSGEPATRRFGGTRSGGFMAVIEPVKGKEDA